MHLCGEHKSLIERKTQIYSYGFILYCDDALTSGIEEKYSSLGPKDGHFVAGVIGVTRHPGGH